MDKQSMDKQSMDKQSMDKQYLTNLLKDFPCYSSENKLFCMTTLTVASLKPRIYSIKGFCQQYQIIIHNSSTTFMTLVSLEEKSGLVLNKDNENTLLLNLLMLSTLHQMGSILGNLLIEQCPGLIHKVTKFQDSLESRF